MPTYDPTAANNSFSVAYAEFSTDVTVSGTTEAAANSVVEAPGFIPNGRDSFWLEFVAPGVSPGASAGASVVLVVYDNGSPLFAGTSAIAQVINNAAAAYTTSVSTKLKIKSPTAVVHVYSVRAFRAVANGTVNGTSGGIGRPGSINITREGGA